ncbi:PREDICTED: 39S ribosomal protein L19, mitochondrial [Dufourea novaeangliae]|uniref:Large ribosomal subunit protein bL19m n=1 Tax=Dufourea novaeangliae TaxID=178035 RepID=A0A154PIK6_DUFNO|nr:PREDICTED: 39S ribosomal protein L19, mitochondrial [Dufourea novaeangliae]KZC11706.1 39S ribosomal protein L19, mitochondrial [Dufourea novaeangliae]
MVVSWRVLSYRIWQNQHFLKSISKEGRAFSSLAQTSQQETIPQSNDSKKKTTERSSDSLFSNYRHIYPEFLPDPNPLYRNSLREKLERNDMLARRAVITIPEFYVGSIVAVTYAEPHATGKVNRFVGICILREGCGLRASFLLRNVVDNEGVEVRYELYDPAIQKIECLRLEKRLDNKLLYLRDAPAEYSTFPFDMEPEKLPEGTPVPVNEIVITLKDQKWLEKWERQNLKGVVELMPFVSQNRRRKAAAAVTPWEKYDLMKIYRETIPQEEQEEIFSDLQMDLKQLEVKKSILKRKRTFSLPKKSV